MAQEQGSASSDPMAMATGASEHSASSSSISLDTAIQKMTEHSILDDRGNKILGAAVTLRDSSGRDRKDALRLLTSEWK